MSESRSYCLPNNGFLKRNDCNWTVLSPVYHIHDWLKASIGWCTCFVDPLWLTASHDFLSNNLPCKLISLEIMKDNHQAYGPNLKICFQDSLSPKQCIENTDIFCVQINSMNWNLEAVNDQQRHSGPHFKI